MFQIIGAMAQFERSLIQERVRAGLRNARAKGKKFGRPRVQVDAVRVSELRRDGLSWSQVCRTLNVSKGSAQRSVARLPGSGAEFKRIRSEWPTTGSDPVGRLWVRCGHQFTQSAVPRLMAYTCFLAGASLDVETNEEPRRHGDLEVS